MTNVEFLNAGIERLKFTKHSKYEIYFKNRSKIPLGSWSSLLISKSTLFLLNLHSPWSRIALSPVGWPVSWQCLVCWDMSQTQWTWLTRWIGCGGNTQTRRSLLWSPYPEWWSGWPLMSFWSGDMIDMGRKRIEKLARGKKTDII